MNITVSRRGKIDTVRIAAEVTALISPKARKLIVLLGFLQLLLVLFLSMFQKTFSPLIGVSLASLGFVMNMFAISPQRRHFTPLIWALWFNLGCVLSFADLLLNEATYSSQYMPLTGAFAFTDPEMWRAILVLIVGSASVMATAAVGGKVLSRSRPIETYGSRLPSLRSPLTMVLSWTGASLALALFLGSRQIGRTGLVDQTVLPFHLSGFLNFSRTFLVPCTGILILDLLMSGGHRRLGKLMLLCLGLVGLVGSLTTLSRGYLGILVLVTSLYLFISSGRHSISLRSMLQQLPFVVLFLSVGVFYVNYLRNFGYAAQKMDIGNTVSFMSRGTLADTAGIFHTVFLLATSRIGGLQELLAVLSAPHVWQLSNPLQMFLGNGDDSAWLLREVYSFVSYSDGTVATGMGFGLWGTLMLSGSLIVTAIGSMMCVLFSLIVEEIFFRLGARSVALCLAVYIGLQLWGFPTRFTLYLVCGMTGVIYLTTALILRHYAMPSVDRL